MSRCAWPRHGCYGKSLLTAACSMLVIMLAALHTLSFSLLKQRQFLSLCAPRFILNVLLEVAIRRAATCQGMHYLNESFALSLFLCYAARRIYMQVRLFLFLLLQPAQLFTKEKEEGAEN